MAIWEEREGTGRGRKREGGRVKKGKEDKASKGKEGEGKKRTGERQGRMKEMGREERESRRGEEWRKGKERGNGAEHKGRTGQFIFHFNAHQPRTFSKLVKTLVTSLTF